MQVTDIPLDRELPTSFVATTPCVSCGNPVHVTLRRWIIPDISEHFWVEQEAKDVPRHQRWCGECRSRVSASRPSSIDPG